MGRSHSGPTKDPSTKLPRVRPSRERMAGPKMGPGARTTKERAEQTRLPKLLPIASRDRSKLSASPQLIEAMVGEVVAQTAAEPTPPPVPVDEIVEAGVNFRGKGPLSLEEKVYILEHRFKEKWGDKRIAKALRRDHRTITEFVNRYRSTSTLARALLEKEAETLARRVVRKANVEQAMEVLNRIDVLPEKEKSKSADVAPSFNIIVGNPGQTNVVMPVPDQRAIEAARTPKP